MENKTAMQMLIEWGDEQLMSLPPKTLSFHEVIDKAEELLSIQREQIQKAYNDGIRDMPARQPHQYYQEIYN